MTCMFLLLNFSRSFTFTTNLFYFTTCVSTYCTCTPLCCTFISLYCTCSSTDCKQTPIYCTNQQTVHLELTVLLEFSAHWHDFTWTTLLHLQPDLWPTVKHSPAELGGGGQREAGVVKLVAVVTNADLELDGIVDILEERGRVKRHEERELPLPEKLLWDEQKRLRDGWYLSLMCSKPSSLLPSHLHHHQVIWGYVFSSRLRLVRQFCS